MSAQPKYRPSLTLDQLKRIRHLVTRPAADAEPIDAMIRRVIDPMIYKASEGIIQPAFVTAPKQSIEDSLGFSQPGCVTDPGESLYQLWRNNVKLSDSQIESAMGYGFNNDLLTEEECDRYTQLLMKSS